MNSQKSRNIKMIVNLLVFALIVVACLFLLPWIIRFFMPFVIGWIIAWIANPLVVWLEKHIKIKRRAGTVIVIVLVIAGICFAIYEIVKFLAVQTMGFISDAPGMWDSFSQGFTNLGTTVDTLFAKLSPNWTETLNEIGTAIGEWISGLASTIQSSQSFQLSNIVGNVAGIIIGVIMTLMSSYFFIADRENITKSIAAHLPDGIKEKYDVFVNSLKQAVGGYFKAQLQIELWIYVLLLVGLMILKVKYSTLIALVIAVLDFLPVFGAGAVLWPWALVSLLGGDFARAIGFMIIWGLSQLVRQMIQPKIVGDSIGIEPLPTLFLLFIGYRVAGFGGMIFAIPVGIIIKNMNEAGFFDTAKYSFRILIRNLNDYRELDESDMEILQDDEKD